MAFDHRGFIYLGSSNENHPLEPIVIADWGLTTTIVAVSDRGAAIAVGRRPSAGGTQLGSSRLLRPGSHRRCSNGRRRRTRRRGQLRRRVDPRDGRAVARSSASRSCRDHRGKGIPSGTDSLPHLERRRAGWGRVAAVRIDRSRTPRRALGDRPRLLGAWCNATRVPANVTLTSVRGRCADCVSATRAPTARPAP